MTEAIGYLGDIRQFGPEYDAYLMHQEAIMFAEMNANEIDGGTMEEIKQTAGLLMGIIAERGSH